MLSQHLHHLGTSMGAVGAYFVDLGGDAPLSRVLAALGALEALGDPSKEEASGRKCKRSR